MKIKVLGIMFLFSALVAGGGIDSNTMWQFVLGALVGFIAGGGLVFEGYKKEIKSAISNIHSYPSFLQK